MSDNLISYIKEFNLDNQYSVSGIVNASKLISLFKNSLLHHLKLFTKHKYKLCPFKEIDQPNIIAKLLLFINTVIADQPLLQFLTDICIKIINEKIIILEHANTLINFFLYSSHCFSSPKDNLNRDYFNQFIRIIIQTHNQSFFDLLCSKESTLLLETRTALLQSEHLIKMLSFNNSVEFLSSIIKWNYNQGILAQLIDQLSTLFFKQKASHQLFFIVQKQIELLKSIKYVEQMELKNNPNKLMNGIEIENGFLLKNQIPLPSEDFNIEFSFIRHKQDDKTKDDSKQVIISLSNQNEVLLSFFTLNGYLNISYYNVTKELIPVRYGKTMKIIFKQTIPKYFPYRHNKVKICFIDENIEPITLTPSDYLKERLDFKIGGFKGKIGKISIYKRDKNSNFYEDTEFVIDPLKMLYQYQQKKDYKLIAMFELNKLIRNNKASNNEDNSNCDVYDRPFELSIFKDAFNDNEGLSYILLIMFYLLSTTKKALKEEISIDTGAVYNCINNILEFVFDMYRDSFESIKEPIYTFFYSINLLIDQLSAKDKIPLSLIQLLMNNLPSITNVHLRNNLFMILITPSNMDITNLDSFIPLWPNFIDKADRYTTIFMIQSLIHFYQLDESPKKNIGKLLIKILIKAKGDTKVFYLDKVLQISNSIHLYKLLKVYYMSLPQTMKEPMGTFTICNRLFTIYSDHSIMKNKYSALLQALIIRLIDEIFIRYELKTSKGFIHQSIEVNNYNRNNESSNLSQNNIILNRIETIIDKAQINIHSVRSIFLLVFYLSNQSSSIAFIKNKSELKTLNYSLFNSKYIIATVFKLINRLKPMTPEFNEYCVVLHNFLNEILNKVGERNNQKFNDLFESQKIFGDIYMNIIQTKAFPQEEIISDFTLMIEKTFTYHSNPFYFNFIYRLTPYDQQTILIQPIISKMINFKFDISSKGTSNSLSNNSNTTAIYSSNNKNLIILLYKLLFFSSIEKKCLYDSILIYIKNNLKSPLIYSRLLYEVIHPHQKLFLIEMLIEMIIEYYIQNKDADFDILKSFLLLSNEKKETHTIFYYIDIWDNTKDKAKEKDKDKRKDDNHYFFIKEIVNLEECIQDNTGVRNPYHLMYYFAIRICKYLQKESITQSKSLLNFFNDLLKYISNDLNKHNEDMIKSKTKQNIKIKVNDDIFYKKFKSKLKAKYKVSHCLSPTVIKDVYNELNIQRNTIASTLSYDTCDSTILEQTNASQSEFSMSETYSINKNSNETNSTIFFDLKHEEKQLNRWFKLMKTKGIKLIYKAKTELMKGSLSVFFKKYLFYNDQFDSILNEKYYQYINYNSNANPNSSFLPYPTKLRNYTTDNFTQPFLSINRHFFNDPEFFIGHSYLKANEIDNSIINDYCKYHMRFNFRFQLDCELIKNEGSYYSSLFKYKKVLIIETKKADNIEKKYPLSSIAYLSKTKQIIVPFTEIKEVIVRRFLFQLQAVEFFLFNGKSYFLNLFNKEGVDAFFQLLQRVQNKNKYVYQLINNPKYTFNNRKYTAKWKNHQMSTFDYFLLLNKYSGRSYNDLNQYSIFPWVLLNYHNISNSINKEYRQFEYPISIQSEEKRIQAMANYENAPICLDDYYHIPSHFHSHYSTYAVVYYFLNRLEPFTRFSIQFQSNQLDNPNRQFYSLNQTMINLENANGSRELLPEFFFFPEALLNLNYVFFGYKEGNELLNNVVLPINCINEEEMIYLHKDILNSNEVGRMVSKWIDNIFGYSQLIRKKESLNVFQGHSYEQIINERNLLKEDIDKLKAFIINLGQTPMQLFTSAHPIREIKGNSAMRVINQKQLQQQQNKQEQQKQQSIGKEAQPLSNLLSQENISRSVADSFKLIDFEIKDIKSVVYTHSYIILISQRKIKVLDKKIFNTVYNIQLDSTFLILNKNCLIPIGDCSYLICANYYDKTIKIYQKDKLNPIHIERAQDYIMCLCLGISNNDKETTFYSGSSKGLITKWSFTPISTSNSNQKSLITKDNRFIAHNGSVVSIIISEYLSAIISSGQDCCIYFRNIYSYETLSCIDVGFIPNEVILFDSMFIYAFGDKASGYTLNGVKFTEVYKEYKNPQLLGDKLFVISGTDQTLVQLNLFDFTQEIFQVNLISQKERKIVKMHLNEEEKLIDCYLIDKGLKRIFLIKNTYEINVEPSITNFLFYPDF